MLHLSSKAIEHFKRKQDLGVHKNLVKLLLDSFFHYA